MLIALNPTNVVTVMQKLAKIASSTGEASTSNTSRPNPATASMNRLIFTPNQPNSETAKARLTTAAPLSPNATRTSRYELIRDRAPMTPMTAPMTTMMTDPQSSAQAVLTTLNPAPTSNPVTNVGSENATIAATAATRGHATS